MQVRPIPERVKLIASMAATLYASYHVSKNAKLIKYSIREAEQILQEVERIYKVE